MIFDIRKLFTYFKTRWPIKRSTNGWYQMECPFGCIGSEGKKKFCVSFERQQVKCWRCAYKCSVTDFICDFQGVDFREANNIVQDQEVTGLVDADMLQSVRAIQNSQIYLPYGFRSLAEGDGVMGIRARQYVTNRGFDVDRLDNEGFGYCELIAEDDSDNYFGYIIMPFKKYGVLKYFIGRDYIGNFLRYKNPKTETFGIGKGDLFFNEDALDVYDEIFMFEGLWDAKTMGPSAISAQGWSLSPTQKSMLMRADIKRLVFAPDKKADDDAEDFYVTAVRTAMDFLDIIPEVYVINVNNIPPKLMPNGKYAKDCNDLGRDAYLQEYSRTKQLDLGMAMAVTM